MQLSRWIGLFSIIPGAEGAKDAVRMHKRASYIKAPRMELAFVRGVGPRQFQYAFKMMPKV